MKYILTDTGFWRALLDKNDKLYKIDSLEVILNLEIIHKIEEKDYIDKALKTTFLGGRQCKKISFADNIIGLLAEKFQDDILLFLSFDYCLIEECRKFVKPHDKCWEIACNHKREC